MEIEDPLNLRVLNIKNLFSLSHKYYKNTKNEGFYISKKSVSGFHIGVYKPVDSFIWKDYVPENLIDFNTVSESYFKHGIFKSFYCDACAITEPDGVIIKKPCNHNYGNKTPLNYPKTVNVANLVNYEVSANGISFIICASAQQYYYNHLLFQSLDHRSSYTIFEDHNLFTGMYKVLERITQDDPMIKMVFNGNFGSNRWHFHTHITNQSIDYVDLSPIHSNPQNEDLTYSDCIKFKLISSTDIIKLFKFVQKYSRIVYSSKDYTTGGKYLSAVFSVRNIKIIGMGVVPHYTAHLVTGNTSANITLSDNSQLRLILPSAIVNVTSLSKNHNIKNMMEEVKAIINSTGVYEHLSEVTNGPSQDSTELLELEFLFGRKSTTEWGNDHKLAVNKILNTINSCMSSSQACEANSLAYLKYILSRYIIYFMHVKGIKPNSTPDNYIDAYRSLYKEPMIRDFLIKFGFYHMHKVYGDTLSRDFTYLKGSIGLILGKSEFENYFMVSSDNFKLPSMLRLNKSVNEWISTRASKLIGEPSGCGNVVTANLTYDMQTNFVIKTSKLNATCTPLEEEFSTGFKLNELRSIIPNILLTYGGFTCNKGSGDYDLCDDIGISTSFLALEFVKGITFRKYVLTATDRDILAGIYQILFALHFAQKRNKFTHYDLHDENILVSELEAPVQYNYRVDQTEYIFSTNINCTLIDFGWARVDGVNYNPSRLNNQFGADITFSSHRDIYTILMSTLRYYISVKDQKSIEDLRDKNNVLGELLGKFWDTYIKNVTYEDMINNVIAHRSSNQNSSQNDIFGSVAWYMNDIAIKGNMGRYITFLPKDYNVYPNPIFGTPLTAIKALFNAMKEEKNSTVNVYNWGDTDKIGCDMRDTLAPKKELIDHISNSLK